MAVGFRAMFFTVFGYNSPRIESAAMDGSNRHVVVGEKIVYPVGLALDLANNYIYWIGMLHQLLKPTFLDGDRCETSTDWLRST